jgi:amino acid permease
MEPDLLILHGGLYCFQYLLQNANVKEEKLILSNSFAMGWNYAMQWLVTMPLELSAASIVVNYWNTGVNNGVFITIFLLLIICINLFGVKGYGEAEFVFSIVKVLAVIGFIICAIVIDVGGYVTRSFLMQVK